MEVIHTLWTFSYSEKIQKVDWDLLIHKYLKKINPKSPTRLDRLRQYKNNVNKYHQIYFYFHSTFFKDLTASFFTLFRLNLEEDLKVFINDI